MRQDRPNTPIQEAEWLRIAADEKATSVLELAPPNVRDVIEIGAGTGAILRELDARGFAERYWACEPAEALAAQIPALDRLVAVEPTTFDCAFEGKRFDLAIVSHVVEHLLGPAVLLAQALRRAEHVLVEVPIEGNLLGNMRAQLHTLRGKRRLDNPAGHVQFFSRRSARALIQYAGGAVIAERGYFPRAPYAAQPRTLHRRAVLAASKVESLGRLYYEHFAMLCTVRVLPRWDHIYARPA